MEIGNFSVSLAVKNLITSKIFYEKIGFKVFGGSVEHHYLIMKNGATNIGLFEGMFESNILTFNPGWDSDAKALEEFTDIREIHKVYKKHSIEFSSEELTSNNGPANFTITDPDGNIILIDQHV